MKNVRTKAELKQCDAYANLFAATRLARMVVPNTGSRSKIVIRIE
jgi:hypothetical protein